MDYSFVVVTFGDKPAGVFLQLGKQLCAEAGKKIHPSAAIKIVNDSYVDDHITGGSASEVKKMMGERKEDGSYTGTNPIHRKPKNNGYDPVRRNQHGGYGNIWK